MRDKRQLLLPSKSCGYGIDRTKVIVCRFFFSSYLTFPHFVLLSKRNFALECHRGYSNNGSIGSTVKPLLSGHLRTFPSVRFVKIAQCLLTINIQWLLCTVIKFHVVEVPETFLARFPVSEKSPVLSRRCASRPTKVHG